jgi:hypothetical protein
MSRIEAAILQQQAEYDAMRDYLEKNIADSVRMHQQKNTDSLVGRLLPQRGTIANETRAKYIPVTQWQGLFGQFEMDNDDSESSYWDRLERSETSMFLSLFKYAGS